MQCIIENYLLFDGIGLIDLLMQLVAASNLEVHHLVEALESVSGFGKVASVDVLDAVQVTCLIAGAVDTVKDSDGRCRVEVELEVVKGLVKAYSSVLNLGSVVFVFVFFTLDLVKDFFHDG